MIVKLTTAAYTVAATALIAVAAVGAANAVHFAAFPPKGVKASTPTTGTLIVSLRRANTQWNLYADGRIIWQKWTPTGDATVVPKGAKRLDTGYVAQRLTVGGVQLLETKILSTGLFEDDLRLDLGRHHAWVSHQVRKGDRMVTVSGVPSPDPWWNEQFTPATPAQTRALAEIAALMADPATWLPASAWADRQIRAFVPARYTIAIDRGYPEISKLPAPARKALVQYSRLRHNGCQIVTTDQARALLQAFTNGGISPSHNHAWIIDFDFASLRFRHPSDLHLSPARPSDRC